MPQNRTKPGRYLAIALIAAAAIVLADQYTKWLVMESLLRVKDTLLSFPEWFMTKREVAYFIMERDEFRVIEVFPWLNLVMVWNQGVSFGLFDTNNPKMAIVFIAIAALISMVMLIWLMLTRSRLVSAALAMIIGGAAGNIIDRIRFAAVADFIDVHAGDLHWPAFNLADSCIVLGALLLAFDSFRADKTAGQNHPHANGNAP